MKYIMYSIIPFYKFNVICVINMKVVTLNLLLL
jgi:hypothetical protein